MNYKIIIERKAEKEAFNIPLPFRTNIDKAILSLSQNPRPHGCKKLTGREGYRVRVSNYLILYTIDDKTKVVVIYRIKIRGESTYK
ncbi:MAG: type II toxin-antitoxin system RelE/ParE family toxin [Nitrospinae bacterium]|nr:type II toxin-antitoxin system RelE/ParE family toxin [Nitrospinota bacterium]